MKIRIPKLRGSRWQEFLKPAHSHTKSAQVIAAVVVVVVVLGVLVLVLVAVVIRHIFPLSLENPIAIKS